MFGRTLATRGTVAAAALQAQASRSTQAQWNLLLTSGSQKNLSATTLSQSFFSAQSQVKKSFPNGNKFQKYSHHIQTFNKPVSPCPMPRGLATLITPYMSAGLSRNVPVGSAGESRAVLGGVTTCVRGMTKGGGGFSNVHGRISSLQVKKRVQRKKKQIQADSEEAEEVAGFGSLARHKFLTFDPDFTLPEMQVHKPPPREWQVTAYATADEYDLEGLLHALTQQGLYTAASMTTGTLHPDPSPLTAPVMPPSDPDSPALYPPGPGTTLEPSALPDPSEVLHMVATYRLETEPREIYFFHEGSVVFWNITELERANVLRFLRAFEKGHYDEGVVQEESESLTYKYNDNPSRTKLVRDVILLNPEGQTDLEKYTFSNALATSVKLGIWEASLDKYIDNIEYVSEELSKTGRVVLSQDQVLQRMGQLFALRHLVNLSSDLLDVPDFYWEHEALEQLYKKTAEYLSVSKRTSVMNVKLSHCVELMELLKSHLNDRHSARLEWIIIILIMVEVAFELLHFVERLL